MLWPALLLALVVGADEDLYTTQQRWVVEVVGEAGRIERELGNFATYDEALAAEKRWSDANPNSLKLTRSREITVRIPRPPRNTGTKPTEPNLPSVPTPGTSGKVGVDDTVPKTKPSVPSTGNGSTTPGSTTGNSGGSNPGYDPQVIRPGGTTRPIAPVPERYTLTVRRKNVDGSWSAGETVTVEGRAEMLRKLYGLNADPQTRATFRSVEPAGDAPRVVFDDTVAKSGKPADGPAAEAAALVREMERLQGVARRVSQMRSELDSQRQALVIEGIRVAVPRIFVAPRYNLCPNGHAYGNCDHTQEKATYDAYVETLRSQHQEELAREAEDWRRRGNALDDRIRRFNDAQAGFAKDKESLSQRIRRLREEAIRKAPVKP